MKYYIPDPKYHRNPRKEALHKGQQTFESIAECNADNVNMIIDKGFIVIDFDIHNDTKEYSDERLEQLQKIHEILKENKINYRYSKSSSGIGEHIIFKCPSEFKNNSGLSLCGIKLEWLTSLSNSHLFVKYDGIEREWEGCNLEECSELPPYLYPAEINSFFAQSVGQYDLFGLTEMRHNTLIAHTMFLIRKLKKFNVYSNENVHLSLNVINKFILGNSLPDSEVRNFVNDCIRDFDELMVSELRDEKGRLDIDAFIDRWIGLHNFKVTERGEFYLQINERWIKQSIDDLQVTFGKVCGLSSRELADIKTAFKIIDKKFYEHMIPNDFPYGYVRVGNLFINMYDETIREVNDNDIYRFYIDWRPNGIDTKVAELKNIINNIADKDESIYTSILQALGSPLANMTKYKKAFVGVGKHDSYKSTIINRPLQLILGQYYQSFNSSTLNEDEFIEGYCEDKLLIMFDEFDVMLRSTGLQRLKKLISDIQKSGGKKYQHIHGYESLSSVIILANDIIEKEESENALTSRFNYVQFPLDCEKEGCYRIPEDMFDKMFTEDYHDAWVFLMLEGLELLKKHNGYVKNKSSINLKEMSRDRNSTVRLFLKDVIESYPSRDTLLTKDITSKNFQIESVSKIYGEPVSIKEIYNIFKLWCEIEGVKYHEIPKRTTFNDELEENGFIQKRINITVGKSQESIRTFVNKLTGEELFKHD